MAAQPVPTKEVPKRSEAMDSPAMQLAVSPGLTGVTDLLHGPAKYLF